MWVISVLSCVKGFPNIIVARELLPLRLQIHPNIQPLCDSSCQQLSDVIKDVYHVPKTRRYGVILILTSSETRLCYCSNAESISLCCFSLK